MDLNEETLGMRIRRLREKKGLSQLSLGGKADLSERSIDSIEKVVTLPLKEDLERIAKALDATVEYLRNGDTHAERETLRMIDERREHWGLSPAEEVNFKQLACETVKFRKNALIPLSPLDLENLLSVIRGS